MYTTGTYLSRPCRDTRSVFGPKLLDFPSKAGEASFWTPFRRTFVYKTAIAPHWNMLHEKIETCGPASNVAYLEQTLFTVPCSPDCAKTDVRISCEYRPTFCTADKFRTCTKIKLFTVTLTVSAFPSLLSEPICFCHFWCIFTSVIYLAC